MDSDFSNQKHGRERVSVIAEVSGAYRLMIRPSAQDDLSGKYQVRIEAMHEATERDHWTQAARVAEWEGDHLHRQGKAEALRSVLEKFKYAALLCRLVNDPIREASALQRMRWIWGDLGDTKKALDYHFQALQICKEVQ